MALCRRRADPLGNRRIKQERQTAACCTQAANRKPLLVVHRQQTKNRCLLYTGSKQKKTAACCTKTASKKPLFFVQKKAPRAQYSLRPFCFVYHVAGKGSLHTPFLSSQTAPPSSRACRGISMEMLSLFILEILRLRCAPLRMTRGRATTRPTASPHPPLRGTFPTEGEGIGIARAALFVIPSLSRDLYGNVVLIIFRDPSIARRLCRRSTQDDTVGRATTRPTASPHPSCGRGKAAPA